MPASLVVLLAALALGAGPAAAGGDSVLLATTTSVRDSGLLGALLPTFSERTGIRVRVVAVGTGAALRLGAEGNADLLLTHAPQAEEELVASGAAASRTPFMENHFVLGGPPEDPAGVRQAASPEEAFRRIAAARAPYVSRADDSGTHKREKALLAAAGLDPAGGWPGFARSGSGMALTLQVAGERRAYVLSDAGTFLAFQEHTGLVALSRPVPGLRNVYALLRVSPERFPRVRAERARKLEAFFLERATQERIAGFGRERFGRPLFRPLLLEPTPAGEQTGSSPESPMNELSTPLVLEITTRTLSVCGTALAVSLLLGLPIGVWLGRRRFRGRVLGVSLVNAGMGAPPVVVGLVVSMLLWRSGPLAALDLMYSPAAMVIAQIVIALPLVVGITLAAVGALDEDWELQVRALGIPSPKRAWLLVREIRLGVLAAVIAALGGILSEVGAVSAVGGNLEGETRVLTTAVLMYTQMGEFELALSVAAVLLGITLMLAGLLTVVQQGGQGGRS